ncbi:hypothetical protein FHS85_004684 [Rhodoligotrophos appendicifer]
MTSLVLNGGDGQSRNCCVEVWTAFGQREG